MVVVAGATGWSEAALWTMPLARLQGYYHAAMLAAHGTLMRRPAPDPAEREWLDRVEAARARRQVANAATVGSDDWDDLE